MTALTDVAAHNLPDAGDDAALAAFTARIAAEPLLAAHAFCVVRAEQRSNVIELRPDATRNSRQPEGPKGSAFFGTKLRGSPSLDQLARRDARFGLNVARFIAELEAVNPRLAQALATQSALDVGAASEVGATSDSTDPPGVALEPDTKPDSERSPGERLGLAIQARSEALGLQTVRLSLTAPDLDLETARRALVRLAERVSDLGPSHGLIACTDLRARRRRAGFGPHVYALGLFASKSEAEALEAWWRSELGGTETRVKALGENDDKFRIGRLGQKHFTRSATYMTKPWPLKSGQSRDPLLDCVSAGSLSGVWEAHRRETVGSADGNRCRECGRPLLAKTTGRPAHYCDTKLTGRACKSAWFRRPKAERDTKLMSAVPCRPDEPASEHPDTKPKAKAARHETPPATVAQPKPAPAVDPLTRAAEQAVQELGDQAHYQDLERRTSQLMADDFEPEPLPLDLRRAVRRAVSMAPITPTPGAAE